MKEFKHTDQELIEAGQMAYQLRNAFRLIYTSDELMIILLHVVALESVFSGYSTDSIIAEFEKLMRTAEKAKATADAENQPKH